MATRYYKRAAVPTGGRIRLEIRFKDSAGNYRDTDPFPSVEITDGANNIARIASNTDVRRMAEGHYRLEFLVPAGFAEGVWQDQWAGVIDGYAVISKFDFNVDSTGSVEAVGDTVVEPEIFGINILMKSLRFRLKNTQRKPDGSRCDILSVKEMAAYLEMALSEFNATPAFTGYHFSDPTIYTVFQDILVEGAYLKAIPALMPVEAGREWVVTDNGISVTPASVSGVLGTVLSTLYSEYRNKIKEAKRNHRAAPIGMGAGSLLASSPVYRRLRQTKFNQY